MKKFVLQVTLLLLVSTGSPKTTVAQTLAPPHSSDTPVVRNESHSVYTIDAIGQLSHQPIQRLTVAFSDKILLFMNSEYVEKLGVSNKDSKRIQKTIVKLRKEWRRLKGDEFSVRCKELEEEIEKSLTPAQKQQVSHSAMAGHFYKLGPVDYAKKIGFSKSDVSIVRKRAIEQLPELSKSLREIETKTLLKFAKHLSEPRSTEFSRAVQLGSPVRSGVVTPIWNALWQLTSEQERDEQIDSHLVPRYALSTSGYLAETREPVMRNAIADLLILISAQDWDVKHDASMEFFFKQQSESRLQLQRTLSQKLSELSEKKKAGKLSEGAAQTAEDHLVSEFHKDLSNLADKVEKELTKEEISVLRRAQFLSLVQRYGLTRSFSDDFTTTKFGFNIKPKELEKMTAVADTIAQALHDECVETQRNFVERVFSELNPEIDVDLEWAARDYPLGIPPLEVLLHHCQGYQR